MRKRLFTLLSITLVALIFPKLVGAACINTSDVESGLGCIPTTFIELTTWVLARALGVGGGIAFLLMISGAIRILTSAGDPQNIKNGTETIFSAIQGLIFIIFSLFLLKLIGVDILQIPGFA